MSGIFLIIEEVGKNPDQSCLKATKGGYPHITVVYTGKHRSTSVLAFTGSHILVDLIDNNKLVFNLPAGNAKVNSFFEGKTGKQRYDVLLGLDEEGVACIEAIRKQYELNKAEYSTQPPHVTHSIHYSQAEAQSALVSINMDENQQHVSCY